jgi:transcriptional regulator NrdR family protein
MKCPVCGSKSTLVGHSDLIEDDYYVCDICEIKFSVKKGKEDE